MVETTEILYSVLFIAIAILLFMYNKTYIMGILNNFKVKANNSGSREYVNKQTNDRVHVYTPAESDSNFFNTEYEVTENANGAISDALKDI